MDPRRPPLGALVAALVLLVASAALVAALVGAPPFGSAATPTPTASPIAAVTASPSASPSPAASPTPLSAERILGMLAEIERQVVDLRQLSADAPVKGRLVTSEEATSLLVSDFRAENPADVLAEQTALYRALGLLGSADELGPIYENFLASQVLGFYRTDDGTLYVISDGRFGPLEQITAAHEYTHALQDQHYGLERMSPSGHDQGDHALARLALIEGDATLAMVQWASAQLTPADLADLLAQAGDPTAQEALQHAPPIIRETAAFPYVQGLQFVQRAWLRGGWTGVGDVWAAPPATTEQVLHPQKYEAEEDALAVRLPAKLAARLGDGWRLNFADTHGELVTRIWLETANAPGVAAAAATGWGGDRVGLYRGPNDAWAVAWISRWDDDAEAAEFTAAARLVVGKRPHAAVKAQAGHATVSIALASDDAVLDRLVAVLP